ncbi:hypothetical protein RABR111495_08725 [Rahnella bruchi]|uniref:hypothetical protein n=1 Tax=Rahnella bruchi TaxID=1510573 RepID=UPI000EA3C36D|nr:hypothetical protein [Rahnella bruchi]
MDVIDLTQRRNSSTGVLFLHKFKDKGYVYRLNILQVEELTMRLIKLSHLSCFASLTGIHTSKIFTDKVVAARSLCEFIEHATGAKCTADILKDAQ